jgi:hypothetical protein
MSLRRISWTMLELPLATRLHQSFSVRGVRRHSATIRDAGPRSGSADGTATARIFA